MQEFYVSLDKQKQNRVLGIVVALLAALNISAVTSRLAENNSAFSPVSIAIDGTTYHSPAF